MNVKNELGCENCERCCEMSIIHAQRKFVRGTCLKNKKVFFKPLRFLLIERLQEIEFENKLEKSHLQKEIEKAYSFISKLREKQFTKKEAEKVETFLTHGYQMMIDENKKIFSKLEKMKGE